MRDITWIDWVALAACVGFLALLCCAVLADRRRHRAMRGE